MMKMSDTFRKEERVWSFGFLVPSAFKSSLAVDYQSATTYNTDFLGLSKRYRRLSATASPSHSAASRNPAATLSPLVKQPGSAARATHVVTGSS